MSGSESLNGLQLNDQKPVDYKICNKIAHNMIIVINRNSLFSFKGDRSFDQFKRQRVGVYSLHKTGPENAMNLHGQTDNDFDHFVHGH